LRRFETNGKQWISTILRYILEALLTDPIYGGNPNAIGWKWLDHQPGFPRPPANKRYYLL
jgi:gluconate 2-dehydrogenase gamma chain